MSNLDSSAETISPHSLDINSPPAVAENRLNGEMTKTEGQRTGIISAFNEILTRGQGVNLSPEADEMKELNTELGMTEDEARQGLGMSPPTGEQSTPQEITEDGQTIGPFRIDSSDKAAQAFAYMLNKRYTQHAIDLGLSVPEVPTALEELPDEQTQAIVDRMRGTFASEHAAKFGIIVHGAFRTDRFSPFPHNLDTVGFHGTDASRGEAILAGGFTVPKDRKVDLYPMYGTGVSTAPNASKSSPYFNETGYSSRKGTDGVMFVLDPKYEHPYKSPSALWGDTLPDGTRWQDTHDAVVALPKGNGGDASASNFPEVTLRSPDQAHPIAAVWTELVPKNDPRYDPAQPVRYEPTVKKEPQENVKKKPDAPESTIIEDEEEISGVKPPDTTIKSFDDEAEELRKELGVELVKKVQAEQQTGVKAVAEIDADDPEGVELHPGEAILVDLPEGISQQDLRVLILQHRKNGEKRWYPGRSPRRYTNIRPNEVKTENGNQFVYNRTRGKWIKLDTDTSYLVNKGNSYNERDRHPAQTKIYAFDKEKQRWVHMDTKIGEPRPQVEPEEERLHDLSWRGQTDRILLVGAGEGNPDKAIVSVHGLEVVTYPDIDPTKPVKSTSHIFTHGIQFYDLNDPNRHENTSFYGGMYPHSVEIGGHRDQPFTTTPPEALVQQTHGDVRVENGKMIIKPSSGKPITGIEVACGDTVYGKNHGPNKSGWGRLTAYVDRHDGTRVPLITNESVPPRGILSGSPLGLQALGPDDEIVLSSHEHPSWITGFRILQQ